MNPGFAKNFVQISRNVVAESSHKVEMTFAQAKADKRVPKSVIERAERNGVADFEIIRLLKKDLLEA